MELFRKTQIYIYFISSYYANLIRYFKKKMDRNCYDPSLTLAPVTLSVLIHKLSHKLLLI
jgi:hypothetical protein